MRCVCGSDLWPYRGTDEVSKPTPMGHEYVGVVEEVGSAVTTVTPGQFVIGSFAASDNTCPICRAGYQSSCAQREWTGAGGAQAEDTATARDFAALLPLTLTLSDYAGAENVADLPRRLDTTGAPAAYTGRPGDITYYAPWGNLALFHGSGPNAPGLIRLGRLEPGAAAKLADLNGKVTIALDTTPGSN